MKKTFFSILAVVALCALAAPASAKVLMTCPGKVEHVLLELFPFEIEIEPGNIYKSFTVAMPDIGGDYSKITSRYEWFQAFLPNTAKGDRPIMAHCYPGKRNDVEIQVPFPPGIGKCILKNDRFTCISTPIGCQEKVNRVSLELRPETSDAAILSPKNVRHGKWQRQEWNDLDKKREESPDIEVHCYRDLDEDYSVSFPLPRHTKKCVFEKGYFTCDSHTDDPEMLGQP